MTARDKGLELFKQGKTYSEIADEVGVKESAVKSWASRYWNKDKKIAAARKKAKKLQPKKEESCNPKKSQKKKSGGQPGNINALGNDGGAPLGNTNSLKHGGYSKIYWDTLSEKEKEMIDTMDCSEEKQLEDQIKLYAVQEYRIMRAISTLQNYCNKDGNIEVSSSGMFTKDGKNEKKMKPTLIYKSYQKSELAILRLQSELTRVQRAKTKAIQALAELHNTENGGADDWIEGFVQSVIATDDSIDLSEIEGAEDETEE